MSEGKDDRYDRVFTDPKFWSVPKSQQRLKIDKRFEHMFSDDRFCARSAPVDRRGRPNELVRWADKSKVAGKYKSDLEKFYEVSEEAAAESPGIPTVADDSGVHEERQSSDQESEKPEEQPAEKTKKKEKKKSHKKDKVSSERPKKTKRKKSKETDESIDEATSRLAICNQDWDRIRAVDFLMLFQSFLPQESTEAVKAITIYQSAYGAKRQSIDDAKGPAELRKATKEAGEENEESLREGLAKYQRNRLRYCYAVVECDSTDTALTLYRQLDGVEYEDSCTRLDLRFIPDGTSFDDCKVMSTVDAQQVLHRSAAYEPPPSFVTTALGQTDVKLTWEEEQTPERKRALQALLEADSDADDNKISNLIAPPSDEEDGAEKPSESVSGSENSDDDDNEEKFKRYRALLLEAAAADDEALVEETPHMEVMWDPGLGSKADEKEDEESSQESDSKPVKRRVKKQTVKASVGNDDDVTAFRMMFGGDDDKEVSGKTLDEVEGASDPRFAALSQPEFHRDVGHDQPSKTKRRAKKAKRLQHSSCH